MGFILYFAGLFLSFNHRRPGIPFEGLDRVHLQMVISLGLGVEFVFNISNTTMYPYHPASRFSCRFRHPAAGGIITGFSESSRNAAIWDLKYRVFLKKYMFYPIPFVTDCSYNPVSLNRGRQYDLN
jgi:hypothetical protein